MIDNPEDYIDAFAAAGADMLTIHTEAIADAAGLVQIIKDAGARAGLAINPPTPVSALETILPELDIVTVMSVNPGFGGQAFIPESIEKIAAVRRMIDTSGSVVELEVDGGVTSDNAAAVIEAGADILVAGAAVFGGDIKRDIQKFLAGTNHR